MIATLVNNPCIVRLESYADPNNVHCASVAQQVVRLNFACGCQCFIMRLGYIMRCVFVCGRWNVVLVEVAIGLGGVAWFLTCLGYGVIDNAP